MRPLLKRIYRERNNLTSIISTSLLSITSSFFLMVAFANLLNPNQLGIYQYIISVVSIIASISLTGGNTAIIRAAGSKHYDFFPIIYRYSFLGFIPAILIAICVSIYYLLNANTYLAIGVALGTICALGIQLLLRYNSIFVGIGEFRLSNVLLKAISLGPVFILLPLLFFTDNPAILASSYFFSSLLCMMLVIKFYNMRTRINALVASVKTQSFVIKQHLSFAFHQSVITLISGTAAHLDKIIIFQMLGAEAAAIYYITISIPDRFRGLLRQLEPYLFSKFLGYSAGNYNNHLIKKFFITVLGIIPFIILYAVSAHYIFNLFFPQYLVAVPLTMIYSISLLATAGILPFSSMKAHSTNWSFYDYTIVYNVFKIALFIILTAQLGILGSVIATTISSSLTSFYLLYLALNRKNILSK